MTGVACFKGAEEICGYVREEPRDIAKLVIEEGLPAWRRGDNGTWRALNIDLDKWLQKQRSKYISTSKKGLSIAD